MAFDYVRKNAHDYETVKKAYEDREAHSVYNKSQSVIDAERLRDEHAANKVADWTGGTYGEAVKNQLDKINNREKFTYDLNGDALYQQYKDQYMNQGKLAMQDAMGQAAAMTGGYGNSYAASVGNQAYQGYLQKLNDVVPELYQMAYNKYTQEGQDMKDMYSMLNNAYNTEYGEYRDKFTDWMNEQNRLDQNAYNEASMDWTKFSDNRNYFNSVYNTALDWATNDANTDYANQFAIYQQNVAEQQWAQQMAEQRAQQRTSGSGGSGGNSSKEKSVNLFTFMGVAKNGKYQFKDSNGKVYSYDKGINPYTGTRNGDASGGRTFSNGYQPNNIGGVKLKSTGQTDVVNGRTQTVWTTDGKTKYIWDGTQNKYLIYQG